MKRMLRLLPHGWKIGVTDALVGGVVIIGLAIPFLGPYLRIGPEDLAFDAAQWRDDDSGCSFFSANKRKRMGKDLARILTQTQARPGKREVAQLLGEPDMYKAQEVWAYKAGADMIDCLSFDVSFDPSGAVVGARMVQH